MKIENVKFLISILRADQPGTPLFHTCVFRLDTPLFSG